LESRRSRCAVGTNRLTHTWKTVSDPRTAAARTLARVGGVSAGPHRGSDTSPLIIQRVENFTLSPAHYAKWYDRKAMVLREFEKSLAGPKELEDHPDLNIFL